jgi:hypothetical protein
MSEPLVLRAARAALAWNEAGQRPDIALALTNLIDYTARLLRETKDNDNG